MCLCLVLYSGNVCICVAKVTRSASTIFVEKTWWMLWTRVFRDLRSSFILCATQLQHGFLHQFFDNGLEKGVFRTVCDNSDCHILKLLQMMNFNSTAAGPHTVLISKNFNKGRL